ncbi:DUF4113 domain-containing protein [Pantoea piersonii]|uniref:DUF4113 domain-containing protein n=1 Tax=Pantoea piersonii TaxID=2364647 RepID=UPI0022F1B2F2|nr:DUF4113 domain-containing protein [Pantoea piersonii]WBV24348.1 DUF4113 domain-containing protein [Pantoea piersonii]
MSDVSGIALYLSRDIISLALRGLEAIWCDGYRQAKAGVTLGDFYPSGATQLDMFSQQLLRASTDTLMAATDQINRSGMGKVWFAGQGTDNARQMKREMLSPRDTTCLKKILTVK